MWSEELNYFPSDIFNPYYMVCSISMNLRNLLFVELFFLSKPYLLICICFTLLVDPKVLPLRRRSNVSSSIKIPKYCLLIRSHPTVVMVITSLATKKITIFLWEFEYIIGANCAPIRCNSSR